MLLPLTILGEYITGIDEDQSLLPENMQHMTMYAFFFVCAVIQMIEIKQISPLPSVVSLLYALSFACESILMYFHLHEGPNHMYEQHLHRLLSYCAAVCSIVCILEHLHPDSLIIHLCRPLFCLQQASWFVYIAVQTHSPRSGSMFDLKQQFATHHHQHHHVTQDSIAISRQVMMSTAHFCTFFLFNIVLVYFLATIIYTISSNRFIRESFKARQADRYVLLENQSIQ